MLGASPLIAEYELARNPNASNTYASRSSLARELTGAWRARFTTRWAVVAGTTEVGEPMTFYSPDHPAPFTPGEVWSSGLTSLEEAKRLGFIGICDTTDYRLPTCEAWMEANAQNAERMAITTQRFFHGARGAVDAVENLARTAGEIMSNWLHSPLSRRAALASLAAACGSATAGSMVKAVAAENDAGPVFSPTGPDAERYGAAEGFPISNPALAVQPGNPYEPKYRVGAFSRFDEIYPTRRIKRAAEPWVFKRSQPDIRYSTKDNRSSVADYLSRNPVTGLLVAKDDRILFEHYQYGRTDRDRLISQSMVKSITGLLIGIAISEGAIKSVDDTTETYVPGFKGTEYGRTPIRDLLHMSSGVEFGEDKDGGRDLNRLWNDMVLAFGTNKGTVRSIAQFNRRIAPPGTRFFYASIEADVLGMVLRYATGKSASDYLHDKVWEPIGAEADATWLIDAEGFEVAHGFFNAALRDYARLGRLLAHDGAWEGKQIIPAQWMIDATTVRASDAYLAPGKLGSGAFGYGYLLWLLPGTRRQFALFGDFGQRICVDPASKLVMVQTAVEGNTEVWRLWAAVVEQFG